ncbi:MAG: hypothetical protein ACXWEI_23705, partial [Mycobacterium sp.]
MTNESDTEPAPLPDAAQTAPAARKYRVRRAMSAFAGIIAIVGLIASVVAVWASDVLFDSQEVAGAVDAALQEPAVTEALAMYLTDQVLVAVEAEQFVLDVLPPNLDRLTPAVVGGMRSFVSDRLEKLLADDDVRNVVVQLVERAHGALMKLLEGDGVLAGVTVTDGEVSVNLLPLLSRSLLAVQDLGLLDDAEIPVFTADGDPAQQRDELSEALNRELPAQFGELVVYRSEALESAQQSLASAQQAVAVVKRSVVLVIALTLVALIACVLLSVRRGRTIMVLALVMAATMIIVRAILNKVVAEVPTLVVDPGARAALGSAVTDLAAGLLTAVTVAAVVGVLVALGLYLTGDSKTAAAIRSRAGLSDTGVRGLMASHGAGVALVAFTAAVLGIFFAGLSIGAVGVA